LGVLLKEEGRIAEAIACYRKAVEVDPLQADAHNNLGAYLVGENQLEQAVNHYEQALRARPDYAEAHNNLGVVQKQLDLIDEAIAHYREALRFRPDFPECYNNLGYALLEEGRLEEAVQCYQTALGFRPDYAEGHNNLAYIYTELGKPEMALPHCREALRHRPTLGEAYNSLCDIVKQLGESITNDERGQLEAAAGRDDLGPEDAAPLHFALAGLLEREKRYPEAFAEYVRANDCKRLHFKNQRRVFDRDHCRALFDNIIATFSREHFARQRPIGSDSELPIFVVGMPRSGTTLVEQILASHPQVHGAGELRYIQRMVLNVPKGSSLGPEEKLVSRISPAQIRRLADNHLDLLRSLAGRDVARVVDKMPDNFAHLDFIWTLFPRARVIHCRRDPIDTCLSCFVQNFRSITFATSLEDLAFYYRQYERLMNHWREVRPLRMYEVVYEELVENQEAISRDLLKFIGLDWDDKCLAFHQTERAVQTASKFQVRQPIYKTSMKRWKRYEKELRPLIEALNYSEDWGKDLKSGEAVR
jgi:Flp pilus assembly protein TadD